MACANGMSVRCEEIQDVGPQDWLISACDPAHIGRAIITVPRLFNDCVSVAEVANYYRKIANKSFENVSQLRYFGTTETNDK
jgi:hypothetical protein